MPLPVGTRLGQYDVLAKLGAGGMGEVYRARDTKLGRDVALKVLPESFTHDPERVARFRREAQLLASLNHPHIAGIYGLEQIDGCDFLVLELVDGSRSPSGSSEARSPSRRHSPSAARLPARLKPRTRRASSIEISNRRTSR
jgi:eukaryotic-like serine/threonine-protein kinase